MITIKQEQTNNVIINFPFTIASPYFLIEFVNCFNGNTFTAIFDNLEEDDCSYARIRVTEVGPTGTVNYLTGNVKLSPAGEWTANIYAQTSSTNLDTNLADEFLGTEDVFVKIGDSCEQYAIPYETFCSKVASCAVIARLDDTIITDGNGLLFLANDGTYKTIPSAPVTSVFGRTGAVTAQAGDYSTDQVAEGSLNFYYTNDRVADLIQNGTGLTWTYNTIGTPTLTGNVSLSPFSTTDLSEGTNLYYTDTRVRACLLTGLNIIGSSISATDSVLQAFGKLQNQINGVLGGAIYQSTWNATTNSPALASGTGTKGYYYVVGVAGSTNLDGVTDWKVGDWAIYNGTAWEKVDNTDAVSSVNGYIGAVSLVTSDIAESGNLYFTNARVDSRVAAYTGDVTLSGTTYTIGNGKVVSSMLGNSLTLVTPNLGIATATSINKVSITAPATSATITIADGKTWTVNNTLTITGTDGDTINLSTINTSKTLFIKVTLTSAQILALNSTAIEILPAPGSGKIYEIYSVTLSLRFNSVSYATNLNFGLQYNGAAQNIYTDGNILGAGANRIHQPSKVAPGANSQVLANTNITANVATGNPINGNSEMDVYIAYIVRTL